ncbi:MAG: winged helix-turn-helix domain-containing protein [Methylococcus sp.]|nr:winged helix-turn-helix domain-containing protein [Methylococcus sp.]
MSSTYEWIFPPFRLDIANARLWRDEQALPSRPKTLAVLHFLVTHTGQLVGKAELLDAVWGHRHVSESVLEGCISELRRVLNDDPKAPLSAADAEKWVRREALLARLLEQWRGSRLGERHMVFLTGEAGLGKTTLIEMFRRRPELEGARVLWGQCVDSYGAGDAFLPLLTALQQVGRQLAEPLRTHAPTG